MQTYYDSAEGELINERRVIIEAKRHGLPDEEIPFLLRDVKLTRDGLRDAQGVLRWLGY